MFIWSLFFVARVGAPFLVVIYPCFRCCRFLHKRCREQTQCVPSTCTYVGLFPPFSFGGWHRREWEGNKKKRLNLVDPSLLMFYIAGRIRFGLRGRGREIKREGNHMCTKRSKPPAFPRPVTQPFETFIFLSMLRIISKCRKRVLGIRKSTAFCLFAFAYCLIWMANPLMQL